MHTCIQRQTNYLFEIVEADVLKSSQCMENRLETVFVSLALCMYCTTCLIFLPGSSACQALLLPDRIVSSNDYPPRSTFGRIETITIETTIEISWNQPLALHRSHDARRVVRYVHGPQAHEVLMRVNVSTRDMCRPRHSSKKMRLVSGGQLAVSGLFRKTQIRNGLVPAA